MSDDDLHGDQGHDVDTDIDGCDIADLVCRDEAVGAADTPLPDIGQRRASMAVILDQGMPKRPGLLEVLASTLRLVRIRNLFFGVWDCVFLAVMAMASLWGVVIAQASRLGPSLEGMPGQSDTLAMANLSSLYVMMLLISPFMYALLHALIAWKERACHTDDLQRACRWSFRRLTAVRMLVLGGVSLLISALGGVLVSLMSHHELPVSTVLGLSFSALFLYALLQLGVDWWWHRRLARIVPPAVWIAICALLWQGGAGIAVWIDRVPPVLAVAIAMAIGAAYATAMSRYCTRPAISMSPRLAAFAAGGM